MEYLLSILSGGIGGAALAWLAKEWISVRLKQSIQYEYSEKLESYKTELNSKVEGVKHENQISQLRTSLFFEYQRDAYAALITKIDQINIEWMSHYDPDEGLYEPVPSEGRKELGTLLSKHQLFLDEECLMALSLVTEAYSRSLPYDDRSGEPPHQNDSSQYVSYIEYLQPRIASIFRGKIGVPSDPQHLLDVSVLSAMELVNGYNFMEVEIPPKGSLLTKRTNNAADKVTIGLDNVDALIELLSNFDEYLKREGGWVSHVQLKVSNTLKILDKCIIKQNVKT